MYYNIFFLYKVKKRETTPLEMVQPNCWNGIQILI